MSEERIYQYPVWIRIWHMLNALLCLILIITGLSMQFSDPMYPVIRFDLAVSIHNIIGFLLICNYIFYFTGNLATVNGRQYKLNRGIWGRLARQFHYYLIGIFKNEPAPFPITEERKFNPLQQFTYVITMYVFVPVVFITGVALMFPEIIPTTVFSRSGLHATDLLHILAGFCISIFMFIHIYFCTIGKSPVSNFKSIINGYHEPH
jgi:thiosulfate reductase cytochrome b subunit